MCSKHASSADPIGGVWNKEQKDQPRPARRVGIMVMDPDLDSQARSGSNCRRLDPDCGVSFGPDRRGSTLTYSQGVIMVMGPDPDSQARSRSSFYSYGSELDQEQ